MSAKSISKQLLNSRARIYHSGASSWVAGWLYDVELPDIWVTVASPLPIGSSLTLAVQTEKASIHFMARLEQVDREENNHRKTPVFLGNGLTIAQPEQYCYQLILASPIRQLPNQQSDRKAVSDFNVRLVTQFEDIPARVWDMSRGGACLHTFGPPDTTAVHQIICEIEGREVVLPASLRHSRRLTAPEPLYATGILLEGCSRVDSARWATRYQEAVSVSSRMAKNSAAPMIQPDAPVASNQPTGTDLLQQVSDILDKMRRSGQTERAMILKHVRDAAYIDREQLASELEGKLDFLIKYEQELERSLLETVHRIHCGPGNQSAA